MNRRTIETGLYSVFRFFLIAEAAYNLLLLVVQELSQIPRFPGFPPTSLWDVILPLVLVGYLSWTWLRSKMKRIYLPVALIAASLIPFIGALINLPPRHPDDLGIVRIFTGQAQSSIFLLIPLILISWEYSFTSVALFSVGIVLLDISITILPLIDTSVRPLWQGAGLLIFRTMFFLLIGYVVHRLSDEQKRQNRELMEANQRLSSHAETLEQLAISRERNRLARELHDTLAHTLSAVAVQLEAVDSLWTPDPVKSRELLSQSLSITRSGLQETRRAIQDLRATSLEDLGFLLALRNLVQSFAERSGLDVKIDFPDQLPEINPRVEQAYFRVLEEALRNISQHSRAQHVSIRLLLKGRSLEMEIKDDGSGFRPDLASNGEHFGLRGMREYAESIGATLEIDSQPGGGARLRLVHELEPLEAVDGSGIGM